MNLSLQDKIALIYSLTGSQRQAAEFIGVSHQKIGRLLRTGQEGGYSPNSKVLQDQNLTAAIDSAFEIHKDICKQVAKDHAIPYNPNVPIYYERKPFENGVLGDRVVAEHIHWISDDLKAKFLIGAQKSNKFVNASLGSTVNWIIYRNRAESDFRRTQQRRAKSQIAAKKAINKKIEQEIVTGKVYTGYTPMSSNIPSEYVINDIFTKLDQKHAPAATGANTSLANTLLLQVNTTKNSEGKSRDKAFRDKHPYKAKRAKPRQNKRR